MILRAYLLHFGDPNAVGAAKKCIGRKPARQQRVQKWKRFGGIPYPPEVTNFTLAYRWIGAAKALSLTNSNRCVVSCDTGFKLLLRCVPQAPTDKSNDTDCSFKNKSPH
jgi:hypothetical protein